MPATSTLAENEVF